MGGTKVIAVLAVLVAPALALLTGYKLIADSGNQNKTDYSLCRIRSGIFSHVIKTKIVYKIGI